MRPNWEDVKERQGGRESERCLSEGNVGSEWGRQVNADLGALRDEMWNLIATKGF